MPPPTFADLAAAIRATAAAQAAYEAAATPVALGLTRARLHLAREHQRLLAFELGEPDGFAQTKENDRNQVGAAHYGPY